MSTGGAGGAGFSNGGGGGNGYYCAGVDVDGVCIGDGGADGSGGGGGGSSAVCVGSSCQAGVTPLVVAAGGGGGGESMCAGSDGGGGGTGGGGSSTSSVDLTGAGPSGTNGGMGATSGDVGGVGGVNNTGDSASGTPGGPGSSTVSLGDSAGNGGGGGGYVGGNGSTATAGVDCGAGGGGGAGSSWALNLSGATFSTTSASASATLTFYGFVGTAPSVTTNPASTTVERRSASDPLGRGHGEPVAGRSVAGLDRRRRPSPASSVRPRRPIRSPPSAGDNGNVYRAVFVNSIGSATTSPATLTVDSLPVVTQQPANATVLTGQDASFTAAATGNPSPTVQWEVSTDGGTTFSAIPGATNPTYTFATGSAENGDQYEAVFTNSVGPTASNPATLTLESVPVISTNPANVSVITGQTATFVAGATGLPTPTVQWEVSTSGGPFTAIPGATSPTYSLTTALADNGNQYEADFSNPAGSTSTNPATLTVLPIPPLTITTASLPSGTVYQKSLGNKYSATLAASGGNPPYKWSIALGSLPTGLKLSKSTGVISGKPSFAGTFTFTAKVVDEKIDKAQHTATKVLSITIG